MYRFLRERRPEVLLIAVSALLFILMAVQVRGSGASGSERLLMRLLSPVVRLTAGVSGGLSGLWTGYVDLRDTRARNEELEAELTRLRVKAHETEETLRENERLKALLDLKRILPVDSIAAKVIGNRSLGLSRTLLVDRGSADGVRENMPVVVGDGVVGRVWTVASHLAKIQLITDSDAGTAVLVQRTRVQGILQGRGDVFCSMEYVSQHDDVQVGDLIVTNGLDGIYPKGLPVGPVERVAPGQGEMRIIAVTPRAKFNRLEEVLILMSSEIATGVAEPEPAPAKP